MVYLLKAFGHTPLAASGGEDGLKKIKEELPDLIICDVQMPHIDGYQVANYLKQDPQLRKIPLLAVTAFAMVGDRDNMLAAGFDGYISKPIDPETFVRDIEKFMQPAQRATPRQTALAFTKNKSQSLVEDKNLTIMVVDNSMVNRALVRSTLEPAGYKVKEAKSVAECLKLITNSPPDLILSDIHMPFQSGLDLLKIIKSNERFKQIPFILITSSSHYEAGRSDYISQQQGVMEFIVRPIEPQILISKIADCLAH